MNKLLRSLFVLALVAGVHQAQAADPGVTPTSILIGQSAAFTGPAMELGTEMRAGALAYFQSVNAAGGINGRKIELRSLDDGYEPAASPDEAAPEPAEPTEPPDCGPRRREAQRATRSTWAS